MNRHRRTHPRVVALAVIALVCIGFGLAQLPPAETLKAQGRPAAPAQGLMPGYDGSGALLLPSTYQQWVFVGASLGLSYSEGTRGAEMFHETLMEPSAYEHYVRTGEFREGTMLALLLHDKQSGVLPGRQGQFAGPLAAVEMAVKDKRHRAEGWAYYNFGGAKGLRPAAQAMPKESCFNCHAEHAKYDNVFMQFYPILAATRPASPRTSTATPAPLASPAQAPANQRATPKPVALLGLDPVLLVEGREELGKPEIVAEHDGFRYQFVSEPDRVRFAANPSLFAIQNKTCLVVDGAAIDPTQYAVHEKRVYAFATPGCIDAFKANPAAYVKKR